MKKVLSVLLALALLPCLFTMALADTGAVELELKADDGSVATAVFPNAYLKEGVVNIDGEDREVTAVIVDDTDTITVDKAVTGAGYLAWDVTPSGAFALQSEEKPVKVAAGEHILAAFIDGETNTDSPFFAYTYYSEEWGADAVMMYDLLTFTAADGSTVCVTYAQAMGPAPVTGDVEQELRADDGSVATAVFPNAYLKEGVVNIDGEDREVTAVIVDDTDTITVDKAVTGAGYLAWDVTPSGAFALQSEEKPVKVAAGEHILAAFIDGETNTDSPFFAYTYYSEEWGSNAVMMYDLLTFTAADGSTVCVTYTQVMGPAPAPDDPDPEPDPEPPAFTDVTSGDWFADAVDFVVESGLMNGTGDGVFSPNAPTTRGMVMTILARHSGVDTAGSSPWFQAGMDWAQANGVSNGEDPNGDITREQLAVMLYRLRGRPEADLSVLDAFPDKSSIHSWTDFPEAIAWAVENGIITGSGGKLLPRDGAIRAQTAAMVMRYCEKFA